MVTGLLTNQQIVEYIYDFIMRQGQKSSNDGTCMYHWQGLCCAVGCILDDNDVKEVGSTALYSRTILTLGGITNVVCTHNYTANIGRLLTSKGFSEKQLELFADLQIAHDQIKKQELFREEFCCEVYRICDKYNIECNLKTTKYYHANYPVR